ncbi:MAG: N-acetylmannosamine-6-phosphate 2-epimerase [Phycisphaerae bacterium]
MKPEMNEIIESLRGRLIVSCQALPGNPLRGATFMAAMAQAAELGGAGGIRASGPGDIRAIREIVKIPIIGINKAEASKKIPYITPTFEMAQAVFEVGADIVALDATLRERPGGILAAQLIKDLRTQLGVPVMADISTLEEGLAAADAGAEIVATTLSGYTEYSPFQEEPDLKLVESLTAKLNIPVIAEGRYNSPEYADAALARGAFAVVVGKIISNPEFITRRFLNLSRSLK